MSTHDKPRQQSSFTTSTGQQGGGQPNRNEHAVSGTQQRDEPRSALSRQGAWLGAGEYGYPSSPFGLMRRLTDDMDRLLENFGMGGMFSRGPWAFGGARPGALPGNPVMWSPDIEMFEQAGKLVLEAELPGMRKEDVQAQLDDDAIVISGERHDETRQSQAGRYLSERSFGSFYRVIRLPEGADAENASATFRDGILRIEMPLTQRQRGRKLAIGDAPSERQTQGRTDS